MCRLYASEETNEFNRRRLGLGINASVSSERREISSISGSSSSSADSSDGWYSISCHSGAIPERGGGVRVWRTGGSIFVGAGSKTKEFSVPWEIYSVFGV